MEPRTRPGFKHHCLRSLWSLAVAAGLAGIGQAHAADAVTAEDLRPAPVSTTSTLPEICGDGIVGCDEDCDPPGSFCRGGCNPFTGICVDFVCAGDCSCAPPLCGDDLIDPKEDCDPPGSACRRGTCNARCKCRR